MPKHHTIISGTGRAGTTLLVQLLTELGLDTGFHDLSSAVYPNCHAGMEWDIRQSDAPYIVKNPRLCSSLDGLLEERTIVVDHAFVPVRDLYSAAESRRDVTRRSGAPSSGGEIPGGLWETKDPDQQEAALAIQLHALMCTLAKHGIPTTLLHFPRFAYEPDYLYAKLSMLLKETSYARFLEAFHRVVRPELVHEFRAVQI